MTVKTPRKRVLFGRTLTTVSIGVLFAVLTLGVGVFRLGQPAQAATSSTLNFQARLQTSSGNIVPDGDYHIEFKLYDASTAGNLLWTETRTTGDLVRVVNGYFSVNLGSVTPFGSTINWDQDLWLTMNIGGSAGAASWDGEMSPRIKLTGVPYAFSAGKLVKRTDGSNSTTIEFATPSGNNTITAPAASGTICLTSGNCAGQGGTGDILQGGNSFGSAMTIGTNDTHPLNLETDGTVRLQVRANGDVAIDTNTLFVDAASNRVGIGTDSPSEMLHLYHASGNAKIRFERGTNTVKTELQFKPAGTINSSNVVWGFGLYENSNSFSITTGDGSVDTYRFTITNDGRVGIGTADPGAFKLNVDGSANATSLYQNGSQVCDTSGNCAGVGGTGDILQGGNSFGVAMTIGTNDGHGLNLETNGTTHATIGTTGQTVFQNSVNSTSAFAVKNASGTLSVLGVNTEDANVVIRGGSGGLPTLSGGTALAVIGGSGASHGTGLSIIGGSSGVSELKFGNNADEDIGRLSYDHSTETMSLWTNNTQQLTIDTSGNASLVGNLTLQANSSLVITGGGAFPGSPVEGQIFYRTDTDQLYVYTGSRWQADRSTATKIVAASDSQNKEKADFIAAGSSSDEDAINAAIAALPASGGTVYLLEGTFTVDGTIAVPSNVTITGSGAGTVVTIKADGGVANDFSVFTNADTVNGNSGITITNLAINGNKANNGASSNAGVALTKVGSGSGSSAVAGAKLSHLWIKNMRSAGIYLDTSNNNIITHVTVINATGDGIQLYGSDYNSITNVISQGNQEGIRLENGSDFVTISGNTIEGNGEEGINVNGSNCATITGNTIVNSGTRGVSIHSSSLCGVVSGNFIGDNGGAGVRVATAHSMLISGNTISNNGGSGSESGVDIVGNANGNQIVSNRITDTAGTGYAININSSLADDTYLSNNHFSGTGAASISDSGTNTVYANQATGANGANIVNRSSNSTTAFQIQNTSGTRLLAADSTNSRIVIGQSSSLDGTLTFANATNANMVSIKSGVTSTSYTLTLPTALGSSGDCLVDTDGAGTLGFAACGGVGGDILQGGNTFGADMTIGTNDAYSLNLETNGNTVASFDTDGAVLFQNAVDSTAAFQIQDAAGTSNLFVADTTNGRIGIGTAAPGNKLSINTLITASSDTQVAIGTGGADNRGLVVQGVVGQSADLLRLESSSGIARLQVTGSGRVLVRNDSTTAFQIHDGAGTSNLFIADSVNTRIGIGTATPTQALDVNGTIRTAGALEVGSQNIDAFYTGSVNSYIYVSGGGGASYPFNTYGNLILQSRSSAGRDILLVTGATPATRLIVKDTGEVGIGTGVSVGAQLQVTSSEVGRNLFKVTDGTSSSVDVLTIADEGATTFRNRTNSSSAFQVQRSDGAVVFGVGTSGYNVGVGSAPVAGTRLNVTQNVTGSTVTVKNYASFIDNTNTGAQNTAIGHEITLIDAGTTYANTLHGLNLIVSDTGSQAKNVRGLLVDTSGTTNASASVTTALFKAADSETAFQVIDAASAALFTVDTANTIVKVGTTGSATLAGASLLTTSAEVTTTLRIGTATDGVEFSASGAPVYRGDARPTRSIMLVPEYPGATMSPDGSNNSGAMTSDFCSGVSLLGINTSVCDTTEQHNYYSWTSTSGDNDYDIYIRYQMPSDFSVFAADDTIKMYGWRTDGTNNKVELAMFQADGTQCGTTTNVATGTATWTQVALDGNETSCSVQANDVITFRIRLTATASEFARAGEISFEYRSSF